MKRFGVVALALLTGVVSIGLVSIPAKAALNDRVTAKRCTVGEGRILAASQALTRANTPRRIAYQQMFDKATGYIPKLEQVGYDTAKLKADVATFGGHLETYKQAVAGLESALTQAKAYACSTDEARFRSLLGEARTHLVAARTSAQQLRQDARTLIVPDFKAAAQALKQGDR